MATRAATRVAPCSRFSLSAAASFSCTISTYNGHHPNASRALDILVSDVYGEVPSDDNALGDAVAEYVLSTS